jgi:hypothetical protein
VKAITVRQPHADDILNGSKIIENRGWSTEYRGPLLIHAGLRGERQRARGGLGVVLLTSVHDAEPGCCALAGALGPDEYSRVFGVTERLCHFMLAAPYRFAEPIRMNGQQMIYEVRPNLAKLIHRRSPDWVGW